MSNINLYKIDSRKKDEFLRNLNEKFDNENNVEITSKCKYGISVYIDGKDKTKNDPDWLWVLSNPKPFLNQPASLKAVIVIESETKEALYACTFGMAYFNVDKYCDTEFAFDFARRINFELVKTTTLTSPNSRKNKTVNAYLNYRDIEFNSGEAYAKIKAKTLLNFNGEKHEVTIEIGHSIKTKLMDNNFDEMVKFIELVEDTMKKPEIQKIPVFAKVSREEQIAELDKRLLHKIGENLNCISVSELEIIGVTEVFNDNDSKYEIKFNNCNMAVSDLNEDSIEKFIKDNAIDIERDFLKIKVVIYKNDMHFTYPIKKLIDYTDDEKKCILIKGEWFHYNDDYIQYLNDSMNDIEVEYISKYNFNNQMLEDYRAKKFEEEKGLEEFKNLSDEEIRKKINDKYYNERVFNLVMEENYGFKDFDRKNQNLKKDVKVEAMDLYKDNTMFAVKIGSKASKLNYVVDQSLLSLQLTKSGKLENVPEDVKRIGIWLIFDTKSTLKFTDGKPDLSRLNLLSLKNKLDEWKKEVRQKGYIPIVYVNLWEK